MRRIALRPLLAAVALIAVAGVVAGCGSGGKTSSESSSTKGASSTSGAKAHVAVFQNTINNFTTVVNNGIKAKLQAAGGTFQEYGANFNAQEQLSQCQDAITSGRFNVLIVNPVAGPTMVPCAKQAGEAGIKVVALENPLGSSEVAVAPQLPEVQGSVVLDARTTAEMDAQMIDKACEGIAKCQVIFSVAYASEAQSHIRLTYVQEQAKQSKGAIEIVQVVEGKYNPSEAVKNTSAALASHPNANIFFYEADTSAVAGYKTIASNKLSSSLKILSEGAAREGIKAIKEGHIFATLADVPLSMGEAAGEMAVGLAEGKKLAKSAVNMYELTKQRIITKANVNEFTPQWGNE